MMTQKTERPPEVGTTAWYDEWLTRIAVIGIAFILGWNAHAAYYQINHLWTTIGNETHQKTDEAK